MRRRTAIAWVALTSVVTLATAPAGADPLVTDRPDFTESAMTVPAGRVQLEGGARFARAGAAREHALGELLLRIAAGSGAELRVGFNSHVWLDRDPSGLEDMTLGAKFALARGAEGFAPLAPAIALIVESTVPTGSPALRSEDPQPGFKLCQSWTLSERVALAANLNAAWASDGTQRFGELSGSVSTALTLAERLGGYLEYFGFLPQRKGGPGTGYANAGLTFVVHDDLQLDARSGVGLNGVSPDYFVGVGVSRRW